MARELCERFPANPLLLPKDVRPSRPDFEVECLLNPGAFRFGGRTGLLLRVGERPVQEPGWITTPVIDPGADGGVRVLRFRHGDPDLVATDPRIFQYRGQTYLTTLSHLRLAWSDDGVRFAADPSPTLVGEGPLEAWGMEDCRVAEVEGLFCLTYTAVSADGYGVGLVTTRDWRRFERHGMILASPNKDCAIFPSRIGGSYWALHRPSGAGIGGNYLWIARSPDLRHWGAHRCIARTRPGSWDNGRVGAGGPPIATDRGWLDVYHGATPESRYSLGAMLFDRDDPGRLLARSVDPVMTASAPYEASGFFKNVVFTNGHVVSGDTLIVYYGAADQVICGATFSIDRLLRSLETGA
jgi:beta-1,2-mannobiose phosphorylase / 1,2-beta-oligomannan phosphorylase